MPLFEYACAQGHRTESLVRHPEEAPSRCTADLAAEGEAPRLCDLALEPVIAAPASIFPGAARWRDGHGK